MRSEDEKNKAFEEQKQNLIDSLSKQQNNLEKKKKILTKNLHQCSDWERIQHEGDLIKFHLGKIKKGSHALELFDWATQEMRTIPVDPLKTPQEEMASRYKQSKKMQRGHETLLIQLEKLKNKINSLKNQQEKVLSIHSHSEMAEIIKTLPLEPEAKKDISGSILEALIYREYRSVKGDKIWVGKNAASNDKLTFQLANGNDWWLHISGWSGSHVIIRQQKSRENEEPDSETLMDAMQLALYHSKARNQGEGEICYTQRKNIARLRKKRKPGLVQVSRQKTAWVRLDKDRLQNIKERSY